MVLLDNTQNKEIVRRENKLIGLYDAKVTPAQLSLLWLHAFRTMENTPDGKQRYKCVSIASRDPTAHLEGKVLLLNLIQFKRH